MGDETKRLTPPARRSANAPTETTARDVPVAGQESGSRAWAGDGLNPPPPVVDEPDDDEVSDGAPDRP